MKYNKGALTDFKRRMGIPNFNKKRTCEICEKEFLCYKRHTAKHSHMKDSDEGTFFNGGGYGEGRTHWFCNACWNTIIGNIQEEKKEIE